MGTWAAPLTPSIHPAPLNSSPFCSPRSPNQVFYSSKNPTAAMCLFIIFEFVMNVMMLNIMIASMANSFSKVTQVGIV
jgi:hypothetical protein